MGWGTFRQVLCQAWGNMAYNKGSGVCLVFVRGVNSVRGVDSAA